MEKEINDFSSSLFIWQLLIVILILFVAFLTFKFGKALYRYLKKNS